MSKLILFILSLCASLYPLGTRAQEIRRQVVAVDEMFALADQRSKHKAQQRDSPHHRWDAYSWKVRFVRTK